MIERARLYSTLAFAAVACGEPETTPTTTGFTSIDPSLTGVADDDSTGDDTSVRLDLGVPADLPPQDPEDCVSASAEAELESKPVDVVVFVDTSDSMEDVSNAVEQNLNLLLAAIVAQQNIDVRVIVVAGYGGGAGICVAAPLGPDECNPPAAMAPVGPQLFHYSMGLGSSTFVDLIIDSYTGAQPANPALYAAPPNGWQQWARPEALKAIVAVTDARSMSNNASVGTAFDTELLALAPEQFGTADARNYVLHAITGIGFNQPPAMPFPPEAPMVNSECEGEPGQPLQQIAILSGGLRFPLCGYPDFPTLFDEIGAEVAELVPVACDFAIPEAPEGETINPDTLEVEYLPGGVVPGEVFHQVPSEAECEEDAFWVDDAAIHLCPSVCTIVQADAMARVEVRYGCDVGYDPNG